MDIGVVTDWRRSATAFAAVQLLQFLRARHDVSVLSSTCNPAAVHPCLDDAVHRSSPHAYALDRRRVRFTDWCRRCRAVIWTQCPHSEQVLWANNNHKFTVLVATCRESDEAIRTVYPVFHRVVAPCHASAAVLTKQFRLTNLVTAPWSPRLPPTRKASEPKPLLVYVHAQDTGATRNSVLGVVVRLLTESDALVTVGHAPWMRRALRRVLRTPNTAGRLTFAPPANYPAQVRMLRSHDLSVLPSPVEPFGMTALLSLHVGTPIVAWAVPPLTEFALHAENAVLVPVDARNPWTLFESAALTIARRPAILRQLQAKTCVGLARRRDEFEQCWTRLLHGADL